MALAILSSRCFLLCGLFLLPRWEAYGARGQPLYGLGIPTGAFDAESITEPASHRRDYQSVFEP